MKLRLGLGFSNPMLDSVLPVYTQNFSTLSALPAFFTHTRASAATFQDSQGYWQNAANNIPRLQASLFGLGSGETASGILIEASVTARNTYSRPASGDVNLHFSTGASIASIVTDTENPCKFLGNGTQVWLLNNTTGSAVTVEFAGTAANTNKYSGFVYVKVITGTAPTLSIEGKGSAVLGHVVAGYTLYSVTNVTGAVGDNLRLVIPANSSCRVSCANLQEYTVNTSLIDTAGAAVTRAADDLYMEGANAANWYEETGTIFFDYTCTDFGSKSGELFNFSNTGTVTDDFAGFQTGGAVTLRARSNSVVQISYTDAANPIGVEQGQRNRVAIAYAPNDAAIAENGFIVTTDNSFTAPRASVIKASPTLTFLNRRMGSGIVKICGILHGFHFYNKRLSNSQCEALTNPNMTSELVVSMFGDSNLLRWLTHYSGNAQTAFRNALSPYFGAVIPINKGDSSSSCTFAASTVTLGDYWYHEVNIANGTSLEQALRTDTDSIDNTLQELRRRVDYVIINHGLLDSFGVQANVLNKATYKAAMSAMLTRIDLQLGPQVRYVMQGLASTTQPDSTVTNGVMQDIRDAQLELAAEDGRIIGYYDIYDSVLSDGTHPLEAGYTANALRAANIILADRELSPVLRPPQVLQAAYSGSTMTITTDAASLSGSEAGVFRVTDDSVVVAVTGLSLNGGTITLTLASAIAAGSVAKLWVAYGKMAAINPALAIKNADGYPLKALSNFNVVQA